MRCAAITEAAGCTFCLGGLKWEGNPALRIAQLVENLMGNHPIVVPRRGCHCHPRLILDSTELMKAKRSRPSKASPLLLGESSRIRDLGASLPGLCQRSTLPDSSAIGIGRWADCSTPPISEVMDDLATPQSPRVNESARVPARWVAPAAQCTAIAEMNPPPTNKLLIYRNTNQPI